MFYLFFASVVQGDGTAYIFGKDEDIFTFSMHCKSNFPLRKQNSDLDIELPDRMKVCFLVCLFVCVFAFMDVCMLVCFLFVC